MLIKPGELLSQIESPDDLKKLDLAQLVQLSSELRQYIIDHVSVAGGHFGASLGVVELTIALHYVFNTPYDLLVWDVGHQAYGHKLLTGRKDQFHTNRLYKGISGFPKRSESKYDAFGVGHSSTSISATLGMAVASNYLNDKERQHIAVIGDGAMTAGLAYEGMNQAGVLNTNLLIILNDNCMSIDPNVGALKDYLTDITTSYAYNRIKDDVWKILGKFSKFGKNTREVISNVENSLKSLILSHSNLFETFNLRYFGPIDGHDVDHLVHVLRDLKNIPGPKILHCITTKGKGFEQAEKDQTKWHAPGKFDKITGEIHKRHNDLPQPPKFQDVFGYTLVDLARINDKIMGITPAMPTGSGMNIMMKEMPDRAFDVGIAEQHAVTFSAGLATQGIIPFCNIYSTFMQRAYDQVIHDVCLQNLHVVFCLDRSGLVGADGPTHHGAYDLAYLRTIPNLVVSAPMDAIELRNMMYTVQLPDNTSPISIRFPRGQGKIVNWRNEFEKIEIGKARVIQEGEGVALLTIGQIGTYGVDACEELSERGITPGHYDMRFVKPLDEELLHHIFKNYSKIITVEDGALMGGFGSAILEFMANHDYYIQVHRLGIPDKVIEHGSPEQLHRDCGYDTEGIVKAVMEVLESDYILKL